MAKVKTSSKHQEYLEKLAKSNLDKLSGLKKANPLKNLTNEQEISLAVFECLLNNDSEGAMEIIEIYLEAKNKAALRREINMPKSTMYSIFKHRNPTIKTLAKIMYSSTH